MAGVGGLVVATEAICSDMNQSGSMTAPRKPAALEIFTSADGAPQLVEKDRTHSEMGSKTVKTSLGKVGSAAAMLAAQTETRGLTLSRAGGAALKMQCNSNDGRPVVLGNQKFRLGQGRETGLEGEIASRLIG